MAASDSMPPEGIGSVARAPPRGRQRLRPDQPESQLRLGIKEPTLIESFSRSPYFMGNPDLQPEKARSFDAGVEQSLAPGE